MVGQAAGALGLGGQGSHGGQSAGGQGGNGQGMLTVKIQFYGDLKIFGKS